MASVKHWIAAFRLRTLPLALSSIGMGGFLAAERGHFDALIFIMAFLTTLFLQILSNLANDYGDSFTGADENRRGEARMVTSGIISRKQMKVAMIIFMILSLLSGLYLLYEAFSEMSLRFWLFLILGLSAIWAAIRYTVGKNPYGYAGFGDFFVFIFFGLTGVLGTYFLQTGFVLRYPETVFPAISLGLFAVGVLNLNNLRDINTDKEAGKITIPVRTGKKGAKIYQYLLIILGWVFTVTYLFYTGFDPANTLCFLSLPLFLIVINRVKNSEEPEDVEPLLKIMAVSTLVYVLFFGAGIILNF